MAEEFGDKTEPATPKKLADARRKGFVAKSQDLTISILLLATTVLLFFLAGFMTDKVASISRWIYSDLSLPYDNIESIVYLTRQGLLSLGILLAPLFFGIVVIAILANIAQVGVVFTPYPIIPKWQRINFFHAANFERSFSSRSLIRVGFGSVRWIILVILNWSIVVADMPIITKMSKASIYVIIDFIKNKAVVCGIAISISYIVIAIVDYLYQRWRFNREMKMTRREVKDEVKQLEGDVTVKSKIRGLMRSFSYDTVKKLIPHSDLIISNGGQYAVAIRYRSSMTSPMCICKGLGKKAEVILNVAKQHHIPIVENLFLAQSLYGNVEENESIPTDYYQGVAEALAQVAKQQKETLVHV